MAFTSDAQRLIDCLKRSNEAKLYRINSFNRGDIAQIRFGNEGVMVTDGKALDELLAANAVEAVEYEVPWYIVENGQRVYTGNVDSYRSTGEVVPRFNHDIYYRLVATKEPEKPNARQRRKVSGNP
jgi:hypothetical protein